MIEKDTQIQKRAVFYLSGYDPRGARYYHTLFKEESQKQGALAGYESRISQRKKVGRSITSWQIHFHRKGQNKVETSYNFLDYSPIIRKSWRSFELSLYREMIVSYIGIARIYWDKLIAGMLRKFWSYSWPITVAAILPLILITVVFLIALPAGLLTYFFLPASLLIRVICALIVFAAIILCGRLVDKKLNLYWLLRALSFVGFEKYVHIDGASELWDQFADSIYEATACNEFDEILIVGHSVGSVIAIEVLNRLLEKYPNIPDDLISFLSIGGIVQFPASDPKSKNFQRLVVNMCSQKKIDWVDLGARTDGACYSCVHPYWVMTAQIGEAETDLPRLFPVKFFESFSAQGYKDLKKDRKNFHFQYLKASELGCGFDYFLYVSGGQKLSSHFPKSTNKYDRARAVQATIS